MRRPLIFIKDGARIVCAVLDMQRAALRKLDVLNAAQRLIDLRSPPGNRLETLSGDLVGYYSIRVNDQWRIIFRWENSNALGNALATIRSARCLLNNPG